MYNTTNSLVPKFIVLPIECTGAAYSPNKLRVSRCTAFLSTNETEFFNSDNGIMKINPFLVERNIFSWDEVQLRDW